MRISVAIGSLILLVPAVAPAAYATPLGCSTQTPALGETVTCTIQPAGDTITVPSGAQTLTATVLGAGGGGGGATSGGTGGPGANGARVTATFDMTGVSTIQVYLGAGGLAGSGSTPTSGGAGDQSRIVAGLVDLIIAGGGGGGGASSLGAGVPGTTATASVALGATASTIELASGSAGGGGGVSVSCAPNNGRAGTDGTVTFTFYGANTPSPGATEVAAPAARSFAWRGQGSGSTSGTFTEGTWQNTPSASEWTLPGHVLLGWATDPQFPVSIAQNATGAYDGVIDGRRMIFIPAGKPTFVSGDASLHAIWAPISRVTLIGRC